MRTVRWILFVLMLAAIQPTSALATRSAALPRNDTPNDSQNRAVFHEPLTGDLGINSGNAQQVVGFYSEYQIFTYSINMAQDFEPRVTLDDLGNNQSAGQGVYDVFSHMNDGVLEAEPYPLADMARAQAAMNAYQQSGVNMSTIDLQAHYSPEQGRDIYNVIRALTGYLNSYYGPQSYVQLNGCNSISLSSCFNGARCFVGMTGEVTFIGDIRARDLHIWRAFNGQMGVQSRNVAGGLSGLSGIDYTGTSLTTLTMAMTALKIDGKTALVDGSYFHGAASLIINTDCPMPYDVASQLGSIIRGEGSVIVTGVQWLDDYRALVNINKLTNGPGLVRCYAYGPQHGYIGFKSRTGLSLNGNTNPMGSYGSNTNALYNDGDDFVLNLIADDDPAADVAGFNAISTSGSVRLSWTSGAEVNLQGYVVYSGPTLGGPWTEWGRVPATGAGSYEVQTGQNSPAWSLWGEDTDGKTYPLWTEDVRQPYQLATYSPPTDEQAASYRSYLSAKLTEQNSTMATGSPQYLVYAPRDWIVDAQQQVTVFSSIGIPGQAFAVEDIGNPAAIKAHIASFPGAKYVLLMAKAVDSLSARGQLLYGNDSLWVNGFTRPLSPQYRLRPSRNTIPMDAIITPDSASVTQLWNWTPWACNDWWYIADDSTGLPQPGICISRGLVGTPAEAAAFNMKTWNAMSRNPVLTNTAGMWIYARPAFGNSDTLVKQVADSIQAALPHPVNVRRTMDDVTTHYNNTTRDQMAVNSLQAGQNLTIGVGSASRDDYFCAYMNLPSGFDPNGQVPDGSKLSYAVMPCKGGGAEFFYPESIGPGIMQRSAVDPYRMFWGGFLANRGINLKLYKNIVQAFVRKEMVLNNQPAAAMAAADVVRELGADSTMYEACMEMNCYGPTPLAVAYAQSIVSVDQPRSATTFELLQASPNPVVSGSARLTFALSQRAAVDLSVYDIQGRRIVNLVHGIMNPTVYSKGVPARLSPGVYYACLTVDRHTQFQKLVIVR